MTLVSHSLLFDQTDPAVQEPTPTEPASVTIEHRRGVKADWELRNPVLAAGEPAYETDTGRQKIGDGVTPWTGLPYFGGTVDEAVTQQELADHVNSENPHPVYDDGASLLLLYQNAKV